SGSRYSGLGGGERKVAPFRRAKQNAPPGGAYAAPLRRVSRAGFAGEWMWTNASGIGQSMSHKRVTGRLNRGNNDAQPRILREAARSASAVWPDSKRTDASAASARDASVKRTKSASYGDPSQASSRRASVRIRRNASGCESTGVVPWRSLTAASQIVQRGLTY